MISIHAARLAAPLRISLCQSRGAQTVGEDERERGEVRNEGREEEEEEEWGFSCLFVFPFEIWGKSGEKTNCHAVASRSKGGSVYARCQVKRTGGRKKNDQTFWPHNVR